jgi:cell division protein FtsB
VNYVIPKICAMTKAEIAAQLRQEVGHLEQEIKKLDARCERLKRLVLDLEDDLAGPTAKEPQPDSKFRKAIDAVFGEQPKRTKR